MTKRTPKTTKPEPTAAETYAARRNDIARLLDVLEMELERLDTDAKTNPGDWGHAGSLAQVRGDLVRAVGFLSSSDPDEVERFLADADPTGMGL